MLSIELLMDEIKIIVSIRSDFENLVVLLITFFAYMAGHELETKKTNALRAQW